MSGVKECMLLQSEEEKLELIRQAKKDLFKEISSEIKHLQDASKRLESLLIDDDLKKEIHKEIEEEKNREEELERQKQEILAKRIKEAEAVKKVMSKPEKPVLKPQVPVSKPTPPPTPPKKRAPKDFVVEKPSELVSFEYTLDQIERKLAELKKD